MDRTRSFRSSEKHVVCHGGQQKGKAVSKQRLAHWIVEAVALAYQSQGEPCPLGVGLTPLGVLLPLMRWCTVPLWWTSAELRTWRHRTPSQDSTISVLSQSLPMCWVTGKWAGRTGRCHACCAIPPHPGIRAPFSPPVQFPGR